MVDIVSIIRSTLKTNALITYLNIYVESTFETRKASRRSEDENEIGNTFESTGLYPFPSTRASYLNYFTNGDELTRANMATIF